MSDLIAEIVRTSLRYQYEKRMTKEATDADVVAIRKRIGDVLPDDDEGIIIAATSAIRDWKKGLIPVE